VHSRIVTMGSSLYFLHPVFYQAIDFLASITKSKVLVSTIMSLSGTLLSALEIES
jgi:hypothetical protein